MLHWGSTKIFWGRTFFVRDWGQKTSLTNALSFYRSQKVLYWSKFFEPAQKLIYVLCQSQTFCARQKDYLHSVRLVFAVKFFGWLKKFGPAQNILGPVKGQGISELFYIFILREKPCWFSYQIFFFTGNTIRLCTFDIIFLVKLVGFVAKFQIQVWCDHINPDM